MGCGEGTEDGPNNMRLRIWKWETEVRNGKSMDGARLKIAGR